MLKVECDVGGVEWCMFCKVIGVEKLDDGFFIVGIDSGDIVVVNVVVVIGGLLILKIGVIDFGYCIVKKFGFELIELCFGLVLLIFDGLSW